MITGLPDARLVSLLLVELFGLRCPLTYALTVWLRYLPQLVQGTASICCILSRVTEKWRPPFQRLGLIVQN
jgi:hypothetical protein